MPEFDNDEELLWLQKRMDAKDGRAFHIMGCHYRRGDIVSQDKVKALDLWFKGVEHGSVECHASIATAYTPNCGVEVDGVDADMKKALVHWELAAIGGHVQARDNLGLLEMKNGNNRRGMKHFIIAAESGLDRALDLVREGYKRGDVTKDEFAKTLRAHKESGESMQSEQRSMVANGRDYERGVKNGKDMSTEHRAMYRAEIQRLSRAQGMNVSDEELDAMAAAMMSNVNI